MVKIGYTSGLYEQFLAGWKQHTIDMPDHTAAGKQYRPMIEVLWTNY